ncbi:unnamed protein product [Hyaloperonospora brassicae]|uniref:EXPERA domain-containing protein n=1 Tax=Hyaloperonospora brassicae TaxID=162125 RepID=A0AAV0TQK8_HYABA|nr:unnamed protein product [Hyaloperonospora brassicae]
MDPLHQALLAAAVLLVAVCVRQGYVRKARVQYSVTKRKLELRYRTFVASLSAKWRVVAKLLPHVLFFALSFEVLFWLPDSTTNVLGSRALFSLLSVGYPLMHTIRVIRHKRFNLKHDKSTPPTSKAGCTRQLITKFDKACIPGDEWRAYEASLKYWVIWSFAVCLTSIITLVLPTFVTSYCKVPLLLCNVSLVWMHSSFTRGDIALYALLSPLISPHASRLYERKAAVDAEADERTNFLMRILVSFGVVPERHVYLAKDLWSQGPALFGLIFMFTPGFVTSRGCLLMAFGFPAYATIGVLSEKRTRRYEWWLAYYCVAIMTDYLITAIGDEVKWLPLYYHVKLLVMMWLQFPYFQGAERLFNASFSSVFIDPEFKNE